jgi:ABC-type transport system involved in cytochrome bd biosynthesis fused ATPase/permease subunit
MGSFVPDDWASYDVPPDFWEPVNRSPEYTESANATWNSELLIPGSFIQDTEWRESPDHAPKTARYSPEFSDDTNVVIAVMGATGAGKSTFIKTVSGRNDVIIGDSLSSGCQRPLQQCKKHKLLTQLQRRKKYVLTNSSTKTQAIS